ncbi:MAG: NAD-dependent epimerase/dehydratase family protein [Gemmatimonadota bacterium]|nr:MAG: NAD-dependent epimerase/dehydratase family protein [Gemmatimonadota bacterium]
MRVTVTGATGTLGFACVHAAIRAGHQVRAFVRRRAEFQRRCRDERVEAVEGDILDRTSAGAALENSDAVIHCIEFPPHRFSLNWDALRHALEGLGSRRQFIYPGNSWVYKPSDGERIGADNPKNAPTALGEVRADLERAVTAEGGTVVHLPDVYGPGVLKGFLQAMFVRAMAGQTVWFPGDLDRPHEFLYIEDAARALVAPLGKRQSYSVDYTAAGPEPITPRTFAELIFKAAGLSPRIRSTPMRWLRAKALLSPHRRALRDLLYLYERPVFFDARRLRSDLGWSPEVGYADGVRRTVRWLREAGYTAASA